MHVCVFMWFKSKGKYKMETIYELGVCVEQLKEVVGRINNFGLLALARSSVRKWSRREQCGSSLTHIHPDTSVHSLR